MPSKRSQTGRQLSLLPEGTDIVVQNVTMEFRRAKDEATSLKELVVRTLRRQHRYETFRALDDVSFTVEKGAVMGIVGTNGSGKSTLLKIISGAMLPTRGRVWVDRRKVQLLTLGTGFDPELTGRENVYLSGAIIGYTKAFIDGKYEEIVRFAELEGFMEEKVRNYSSGMVSRLGFAIATARDPDPGRGAQRGGHVLPQKERGQNPADDHRRLHRADRVPYPFGDPQPVYKGRVDREGTAAGGRRPEGRVRGLRKAEKGVGK